MHDLARPNEEALVIGPSAVAAVSEQVGQAQPRTEEPQAADAHHLTPVPSIAETHARAEQTEHQSPTTRSVQRMQYIC